MIIMMITVIYGFGDFEKRKEYVRGCAVRTSCRCEDLIKNNVDVQEEGTNWAIGGNFEDHQAVPMELFHMVRLYWDNRYIYIYIYLVGEENPYDCKDSISQNNYGGLSIAH